MDSSQGQEEELPPIGPVASTGQIGPPPDHEDNIPLRNAINAITNPPSPPQSLPVVTPAAVSESGSTEYFPRLPETQPAPSLRSRASAQNAARSRASSGRSGGRSSEEFMPGLPRQPSIRIRRRTPLNDATRPTRNSPFVQALVENRAHVATPDDFSGRPRSISQPERTHTLPDNANLARHSRRTPQVAMPRLTEEGTRPTMDELGVNQPPISPVRSLPENSLSLQQTDPGVRTERMGPIRRVSRYFWPRRQPQALPQNELNSSPSTRADEEYDAALVDYLDTIDPEVQTLSTLTNVQNSLFVPDLGSWLNRRPTYHLSQHQLDQAVPRQPTRPPPPPPPDLVSDIPEDKTAEAAAETPLPEPQEPPPALQRSSTITSELTESHYAALPHGTTLEGWTAEEKWELDDHVRHMLHSRRSKFKRSLKGFGQYVRRPLGFFVTLYATLITLFGLAWVLFLIGWIYVGEKQVYVIHIIDSVLVALFAVMGDGLAPFRAIDTYHMAFIIRYARIVKNAGKPPSNKLKKRNIPPAVQRSMDIAITGQDGPSAAQSPEELERQSTHSSRSDNPHTRRNNIVDLEDAKSGIAAYEDTPLTLKQQQRLHHHQKKLANSHSFYKPNETNTHYAFPLGYLMAIVILLDCHSLLQISLGACTWGINYHTRPFALTTVILCVSITCNITAGIVITVGDRKTRKKDVWQLMNRQELTGDAMRIIEKKRSKESNGADKSGGSDSDKEAKEKEARETERLVQSTSAKS